MTADWQKSLDSLRNDFRDVSRSYPKLFYARLIAPIIPHDSWRFVLGRKRYLQFSDRPLDGDYVDQYCFYADANADELMCKHGLQQFDFLSQRAIRLIMEIPTEIWELLNLANKSSNDLLRWLDVIDTLAGRRRGEATLTFKPKQVLNKTITIVYNGDSDYLASTLAPSKVM
jgi:hypothetical protein